MHAIRGFGMVSRVGIAWFGGMVVLYVLCVYLTSVLSSVSVLAFYCIDSNTHFSFLGYCGGLQQLC